jgi:ubiquinone/menaquinone biosynthesis C-methylase UbiE
MNIFDIQPDFITRDPCVGDENYNAENSYKRFSAWASPSEVDGARVLDIACGVASAGGYVLGNGAVKYVGVDFDPWVSSIARENLAKYYPNADASIITSTGEDFIAKCTEHFDIIFLGRVIHAVKNGNEFLTAVASIADYIAIETATPLNVPAVKLKKILLEHQLTDEQHKKINQIFTDIEYKQCFTDYDKSRVGDFVNSMYSIGYLKLFFNQLGFSEDLTSYEELKQTYGHEFGMGSLNDNYTNFRKFVIKFKRTSNKRAQSLAEFKGY